MIPPRLPATHELAKSVDSILSTLIETRAVEYKGSAPFADLESHIVKTAMAMANLRSGGYIIIGIAKDNDQLARTGANTEHIETYDVDRVLAAINKFTSPAVEAIVGIVEHQGKDYVVISVSEFDRAPVLCKRDGQWPNGDRVSRGTMFIRPAGFIETRTPQSASELDEVIALAAEKRAVEMYRIQYLLNDAAKASGITLQQTDATGRYDAELGDVARL